MDTRGFPEVKHYRFRRCPSLLLGSGASCEVFALDEEDYPNHPPLCIKVYTQNQDNNDKLLRLAQSEAWYLSALAQVAGVPRVVGVGQEPPCLVMTRHAASFHHFLDTVPSDLKILQAVKELCHVVSSVHRAGFIHNDIKLGNVSVDGTGPAIQVTLLDAGSMTSVGESVYRWYRGREAVVREKRRVEMCPWYAPELYLGGPATPQTDVFSLGYLIDRVIHCCAIKVHKRLQEQLQLCLGQPGTRPAIKDLINSINRSITKTRKPRKT